MSEVLNPIPEDQAEKSNWESVKKFGSFFYYSPKLYLEHLREAPFTMISLTAIPVGMLITASSVRHISFHYVELDTTIGLIGMLTAVSGAAFINIAPYVDFPRMYRRKSE